MSADASVKTWNVNDISLILFGVTMTKGPGKTGMPDGVFLEIEPGGPSFAVKKGVDGSAVIYAMNEPLTTLHVHLMQTAEGNGVLSAMLAKAEASGGADGIGTALAKDNNGASIFESMSCIVAGPPKAAMAGEPGELVWDILCVGNSRVDGGR